MELREKIHESLMGRKRVFELPTVSFREFTNYATEYRYDGRLDEFYSAEKVGVLSLLADYMNFGGYPRVVIEAAQMEKARAIDEIFQSYVDKDIRFLGVEKIEAFKDLLRLLASQIGNVVNIAELSNTLGLSAATVKNYLWYIEHTFIAAKVSPYSRNVRKEISHSPVWYFTDCGLRNRALNIFGNVPPRDEGFLFENVVFSLLKEKSREAFGGIRFWRTISGAEVDFVAEIGGALVPIEAKYRSLPRPTVSRSMRSFIGKYSPSRALIVNKDFSHDLSVGKTKVSFIPFREFVRSDFQLE